MDEHGCTENRTKSYECVGIHNHRKEVAPSSQEMKELVCSRDLWSTEFLMEKVQRYMECNIKMFQSMVRKT